MSYLLPAAVAVLAFTLFRPLTVGLLRAGVLLVRPSKRARRLKAAAQLNRLVAQAAPQDPAAAVALLSQNAQ
jgi:hypothetical protein